MRKLLILTALLPLSLPLLSCMSQKSTNPDNLKYRDAQNLKTLLESQREDYLLIDVRSQEEFKEGHIPGAINIAHTFIKEKIEETDKEALIILYCRSGNRSAQALKSLKESGYTNLLNFGSYKNWKYDLKSGED